MFLVRCESIAFFFFLSCVHIIPVCKVDDVYQKSKVTVLLLFLITVYLLQWFILVSRIS